MWHEIRNTLFGDLSVEEWPQEETGLEPLASFVRARRSFAAADHGTAIDIWQRIVATPDLEARHYLQAWHFLRQSGIEPEDSAAKRLHGVVLEVPVGRGLDLLAAYSDRSVRYYNHGGRAVIWDRPDRRLDAQVDALLEAGRRVVMQIGPWDGERPGPPSPGWIRLNFLTPSGLHFGEAPFEAMASDPTGGAVISAGTVLMQALALLSPARD